MSTEYKPFNKKVMNKSFPRVFDSLDMYNAIRSHGDRLLFKYFVNGKVEEMTYGQFADMILSLSAAFDSMKLLGKKVVVIGDTSPEWLASYIASLISGCIAVPMDKELALTEIEKFMELVDAKAVVYSKSFNEKFLTTMKNHSTVKYFIPINAEYDKTLNRKIVKFTELLDKGREEIKKGYALPEKTDRNKVSEMLFTSGTTGTSKCVMLSQKNIYSVVHCAALQTAFDGNDTILSVLPVHHTYELACLQAGMVLGMKICINDSIRHVTKNMALFKPTGMVLVPMFVTTMYKKIWSEAEKKGKAGALKKAQKLSSALLSVGIDQRNRIFKSVREAFGGNLNKIICGGAKLDPKYIAEFEQFGISIYEGFGITECSPLASVTPYYARKYGSVGPAVDCCSVRIKPNGEKTEQGYDLGEIQVKGDNVMIGYYQNPEATADSFTSDGWFRTGDVGYMDSDGYVFITGRMKFVIVLENGKNVFPEEIEDYLSEVEKISECVVVGRKAEDAEGITLTALIYPDFSKFDEGATDEQITEILKGEINAINRNLPAFKQVRAIEIRREEFEKTTTRKIKRHLVK